MSEPQKGAIQAALDEWNKPYTYQPHPCWLRRARRLEGGARVFDEVLAQTPDEEARYTAEGYVRGGEAAALEALDKQEEAIADLAAEAMAKSLRMGRKARDEFATRERSSDEHVTE